jgi:hypothetical protein
MQQEQVSAPQAGSSQLLYRIPSYQSEWSDEYQMSTRYPIQRVVSATSSGNRNKPGQMRTWHLSHPGNRTNEIPGTHLVPIQSATFASSFIIGTY